MIPQITVRMNRIGVINDVSMVLMCPVVTGHAAPLYKCEDYVCLKMNPGADVKAEIWWEDFSSRTKG